MKNLLLSSFTDSYMLLIILVAVIVAFLLLSLSRRKKEESYRNDLNSKIVPGAFVKTYSGLYGKVISITDTTDGKIILLETGEGDKVSYQQLHINAIFGIDTKRELVFDENGNDITFADEEQNEEKINEVDIVEVDDEEENVEENKEVQEVKAPVKTTKTAKKPASSAKNQTNKSSASKKSNSTKKEQK